MVTGKRNYAVLVSEEGWSAIQETRFVLSVPNIRKSILEGMDTSVGECDDGVNLFKDNEEIMGITNQQPEKARGFLIVAFAILIFITMPIMAMTYFTIPEAIMSLYPKATLGLLYFLGVLNVCSMIFASLIWAWKKIGVYGFLVVLAVSLAVNLYIGVAASEFLVSLTGGAILLFIVQNRWEHFE